jgi:adenylate cyclase
VRSRVRLCLALLAVLALLASASPAHAQCPDGTPPPCAGRAPRAVPPTSVAVLYFDNLSRDSGDAYLADGLTEQTIAQLGQVNRLTVASRYAVRRYRGAAEDPAAVGRALGVAHLVTGSVQRAGNRLRVSVELVRATSGVRVWGQQYDRTERDLLAVQDDIAASVANSIVGRLLPDERRELVTRATRNAAAYDHFLRGNFLLAQRTASAAGRALGEYGEAVRLDPRFAAAHARLALAALITYSWAWDVGITSDSLLRLGRAASDRALALDSTGAEPWLARGMLLGELDKRHHTGALAALERAQALDPRNAEVAHQIGWFNWLQGRDSAALAAYQRALALEPGRAITYEHTGRLHLLARRFREAAVWLDSALSVEPGNPFFRMQRSVTALYLGDSSQARAAALSLPASFDAGVPAYMPFARALILLRLGDSTDARRVLASERGAIPRSGPVPVFHAFAAAQLYTALGMTDEALDALERAEPAGAWLAISLGVPDLDPLRGLPRFQRLRAGLRR